MNGLKKLLNLRLDLRKPPAAGPKPSPATAPPANKTAFIYSAVTVSIIIALSPALFFSFGYHNDFNAWGYDTHTCCSQHPETRILLGIGRYFGAYAQNLQFRTIHSLDDLWVWRLVGILSTALLAIYYLHIVSLRRPPTWQNAWLTVAVFTLPTMQFQAIWVSMYTFWTPPFLLSLAAAQLILVATERDVLVDRRARQHAGRLLLRAFALLLAGQCFYPMSATFLLAPAAHLLVTENSARFRRMAAAAAVTLGCAFVVYFAIHKFIVLPHLLRNVPDPGEYGFNFAPHMVAEALWRIELYATVGAYFWSGLDITWIPNVVILGALVGLVGCAARVFRRLIGVTDLINVLMACCLFGIAAAPLLVVGQFTQTFRVMFTMTAIELLVFFWLLKQLPFGSLTPASVFAVLGVGLASISVYGTALSANSEYVIDKRAVADLSPPHQFHSIIILRPILARRALGFNLRNDFGWLSPIDFIFDLLIGTRYNAEAAFDVKTLPGRGDVVPLVLLEKKATIVDMSPIYGLPKLTDDPPSNNRFDGSAPPDVSSKRR